MAHGAIAPRISVSPSSGTISRGSKNSSTPSPSQAGQAPNGALNENSRGSISGMVKPLTGQAKFSEKVIRCGSSPSGGAVSRIAIPSARSSAVRKESASRVSSPSRTTMRSTTTSMLCRYFLSSSGGASRSWNSPFTFTRWNPCLRRSWNSLRYSPLRSRTIGASRYARVPSGSAMVMSTIWLICCASIGSPVAGEYGVPTRANSSRR